MQAIESRRRSAMLGVLVLGFGGACMMGACGSSGPSESGCPAPDPIPSDTATECGAPVEEPCMRYRIPILGNPNFDVALRDKYIGAFGDACYMSEAATFDCFYKTWEAACADAVKIGELAGNQPYDTGYTCQAVANGDYTLQIGADPALKITINYQAAPRQTPLVEIDGVPTEVNGPYRNLTEPQTLGPGQPFECDSGMVGADGLGLTQQKYILQVNRKKNGGAIHSDLAGFTWLCKRKDETCMEVVELCKEPDVLPDPEDAARTYPNVHHVVPRKDKRDCPWGTNSNKNAAVISAELNQYFTNNNPPVEEVKQLNNAAAYTP